MTNRNLRRALAIEADIRPAVDLNFGGLPM
jgi:hypothetical protein